MEHELAVIIQEIEEGRRLSDNTKNVNILSVLRGTNLVRPACLTPCHLLQQFLNNLSYSSTFLPRAIC